MNVRLFAGIWLVAAIGIAGHAEARAEALSDASQADGPYIHAGPGALVFDASAQVASAGAVIPGASVQIPRNTTLVTELGYRWRNFGVSLTGGAPPLATVNGAGALEPLGALGQIRYGPTVLTLHYHFNAQGRLQPYVGGGPVLLLIFRNRDGAVTRLRVDNHWGAAVQAGVEYRLDSRLALYADVKKATLKTNATALLEGAPIKARIRLDPAVISAGLSLRF